jgi:hypothetical protein
MVRRIVEFDGSAVLTFGFAEIDMLILNDLQLCPTLDIFIWWDLRPAVRELLWRRSASPVAGRSLGARRFAHDQDLVAGLDIDEGLPRRLELVGHDTSVRMPVESF